MNILNDGASKKICTKCHKEKNLTDFHARKSAPDGRKSMCKQCHNEQYKGYRSPSKIQRQQEYKRKKEKEIAQLQAATHKECTKCKQLLPKENFKPRKKYSLDGLNQQCRDCVNKRKLERSRAKGVKPAKPQYAKMQVLESFVGKIEEAKELVEKEIYYLGSLCVKKHDWHGTGYTLRLKSNTHCLECNRAHVKIGAKKYREKHSERLRLEKWLQSPRISPTVAELVSKAQILWDKKESPEAIEERKRKHRESFKKRYAANPDAERLRVKVYKHANPDKVANWGDKRRKNAAKQSDGTLTKLSVQDILLKARKCPYCSKKINAESATIDHLVPISKGGLHAMHNVVACCAQCNFKKSNKDFIEWLDHLDPKHRAIAETLYVKKHGAPPTQQTLPLVF